MMIIPNYPIVLDSERDEDSFSNSYTLDEEICEDIISDSSYLYTDETRHVDWWKDDELIVPLENEYSDDLGILKSTIYIDDTWNGIVQKKDNSFFEARIWNSHGNYEDRYIKVWKEKLHSDIWEELYEGAEFEWAFGKEDNGKLVDFQKISLEPKVSFDYSDIEKMVKEMTKGFEELLK